MSSPTVDEGRAGPDRHARGTVVVDWYDDRETVTIVPRDQVRFEVHKDYAIEVLRLADRRERFGAQLNLLLRTLAEWIRGQNGTVDQGYLTLNGSRLEFVAIAAGGADRDDTHDSLSDLSLDVYQDPALDLVTIQTMLLPAVNAEQLQGLLDDQLAIRLDRSSTPGPAAATSEVS